ncbi:MAG TPA: pseudaminic acid cytidylyltransferase [Candidatus Wallbacteria bacterium]|nr:pseudaminic acid cytidylyltransferase [Candidatus Wallbacteria bacterium]
MLTTRNKPGLLAIIPARSGSKRIPLKNIKEFCGDPIIAYSIKNAIGSELFTSVMVSTDDGGIAGVAKKYGAEVPFYRTHQTSNDHATLAEVVLEVLDEYSKKGMDFDLVCVILPTAPFLTSKTIKNGLDALTGGDFDAVFPVVRFGYPIYRGLNLENERVSMIWPENLNKRSQDLKPAFHDAGQFYWLRTEAFLKEKKIFMDNSGGIEIPESRSQDIDTEEDWKIAEFKYKYLMELKKNEKQV